MEFLKLLTKNKISSSNKFFLFFVNNLNSCYNLNIKHFKKQISYPLCSLNINFTFFSVLLCEKTHLGRILLNVGYGLRCVDSQL